MASLEQRLRGDGGTTARVVWRQDGQRATEKFAVGRSPLLAAKRFQTLVEAAGNRWPEGWVPGRGFVTEGTPDASDSEPTPLLAFGLRYVEQLIVRPGQRARYRAQLKALAAHRPTRTHSPRSDRPDCAVPISPSPSCCCRSWLQRSLSWCCWVSPGATG